MGYEASHLTVWEASILDLPPFSRRFIRLSCDFAVRNVAASVMVPKFALDDEAVHYSITNPRMKLNGEQVCRQTDPSTDVWSITRILNT